VPAEFVDVPKDAMAAAMPAADAATGSRVAELLVEKVVRFVEYFAGRLGREI